MVVKTYGMLMSGEMIRAYKAGLKWQTRRVRGLDEVNEKPDDWEFIGFHKLSNPLTKKLEIPSAVFREKSKSVLKFITPPYGGVHDTLWFKETHALICKDYPCDECNGHVDIDDEVYNVLKYHDLEYRADTDNRYPGEWPEDEAKGNSEAPKWKPSIFMKHDYARFKDIPILNVRVERLLSITDYDARAEGFPKVFSLYEAISPESWYFSLWDKLNGDKLPVAKNPWVWVYEFQKFL